MNIINTLISLTEKIEGLNGVAQAIKKLDEAQSAVDVAAAASQVIAELAVAGVVTSTLRTAMSLTRLGLAVSGNIWKWEGLSKLSGVVGGLTAGAIIDYVNDQDIGIKIYDWTHVDPIAHSSFTAARNLIIRIDPLILDLDGDGLELVGASSSLLFDHNADGIKTGTGWVNAQDGLLVRDINGNGAIDTGRELFGVDTLKTNGRMATDGFDALRDLDSNHDGFITSADTAFGQLKVWRDQNQDGISQAGELKTLADWGITSIGVNGTSAGPQAGQTINNNRVALSTTFTQNGAVRTIGAVDLEANNFYSEFSSAVVNQAGQAVAMTEQVQALPQMNGSGMVRNMHVAASLDSGFAAALQSYAVTTTAGSQRTQLDNLLIKWAQTSTYWGGLLTESHASRITYNLPAGMIAATFSNMIRVLEAFNGSRFYGDETGGPKPQGRRRGQRHAGRRDGHRQSEQGCRGRPTESPRV